MLQWRFRRHRPRRAWPRHNRFTGNRLGEAITDEIEVLLIQITIGFAINETDCRQDCRSDAVLEHVEPIRKFWPAIDQITAIGNRCCNVARQFILSHPPALGADWLRSVRIAIEMDETIDLVRPLR